MQAKINLEAMRRSRHMPYDRMFLGNDPKGEVRAEWSSLYRAFYQNKFMIVLKLSQVVSGGRSIDEVTKDYTEMFNRMEEWCDANCTGLWTMSDNEDEIDDTATSVELEVNMMFEHESDLMSFIRDCAVLMKLTY